MFIGTPTNLKSAESRSDHREAAAARSTSRRARSLLSGKKKVTSSDANPVIGELDMITDGEKSGG